MWRAMLGASLGRFFPQLTPHLPPHWHTHQHSSGLAGHSPGALADKREVMDDGRLGIAEECDGGGGAGVLPLRSLLGKGFSVRPMRPRNLNHGALLVT